MEPRYKVTALKWRPKKFEDVVYQSHVTTTLSNAIKTGRIAHAYLFTGPRGVGKTTVARIFARAVNCLNPQNGEPCEECENCKISVDGRGLDIIEIDGASNRGIDDMRSLQESARYTPSHGKYKIYIIDEIHMITREGFNAFLKTLEEPPEHVIFIGATTEPIKVFPTIISRCQRFDFRRIPLNEIINRLKYISSNENITIDDESLITIAKKGDGSMRDSQSIFDQVISSCGSEVTIQKLSDVMNLVSTEYYFKVTDLIKTKDTRGGLELVEFLINQGYDLHEFILGLLDHFRSMLHTVITGSGITLETSEEYKQKFIAESKFFSESDVLRMMKLLSDLEINYKYFNQPRLRFEMVLMQLIKMDKTIYIDKLLKDVEELKKKVESNSFSIEKAPVNNTVNQVEEKPKSLFRGKDAINFSSLTSPAPKKTTFNTASPANGVTNHSTVNLTLESIKSKWNDILDEIMKQNRINLKTTLVNSHLMSFSGNVLTIACENEFHLEVIKSNRTYLQEKQRIVFNTVFDINPVLFDKKKGETNPTTVSDELKESTNPVVQALIREFGAEPIV
jgi:DNA polymerase III subunit gamma/tau